MTFQDVVEAALSLSPEEQVQLIHILASTQDNDTVGEVDMPQDFMTSAEIEALLRHSAPQTGAQIAQSPYIGVWADEGIKDGLAWVMQLKK